MKIYLILAFLAYGAVLPRIVLASECTALFLPADPGRFLDQRQLVRVLREIANFVGDFSNSTSGSLSNPEASQIRQIINNSRFVTVEVNFKSNGNPEDVIVVIYDLERDEPHTLIYHGLIELLSNEWLDGLTSLQSPSASIPEHSGRLE